MDQSKSATRIDLGVGRFQVGVNPDDRPPQIHFYSCIHDKPIGTVVPTEERNGEPVATIAFHNLGSLQCMQRALAHLKEFFPAAPIDRDSAAA